jgi:hypothetical protein
MKSLDEIIRVKTEVEAELLKLPGVTGVDVGYKYVGGKKTDVLAIRVYVKQKRNVSEKEAIPRNIQDIPTDVIERKFVLHSG